MTSTDLPVVRTKGALVRRQTVSETTVPQRTRPRSDGGGPSLTTVAVVFTASIAGAGLAGTVLSIVL